MTKSPQKSAIKIRGISTKKTEKIHRRWKIMKQKLLEIVQVTVQKDLEKSLK